MKRPHFIALLALATCVAAVDAQSLLAESTAGGPGLQVVLTWPPSPGAAGFNLYRKKASDASFPSTPLNAAPLATYTSCAAIQAVIPPGSAPWQSIANGLESGGNPFDPCAISTIAPGTPAAQRLQLLAQLQWPVAVVVGLGYIDTGVLAGISYQYQLHTVDASGSDTGPVSAVVTVAAGMPTVVPPPAQVTATAGDSRVLLLWPAQAQAGGYLVYRATSPSGPYQRVNDAAVPTQFTSGLDGNPLASPLPGFLDIQRWTPEGEPTTHLVAGVDIAGPADGTTYYYEVVSTDLFGQQGSMPSAPAVATPADTTPPMTPVGVVATAINPQRSIEVRWTFSPMDVEGHVDSSGVAAYRLFRFTSQNAPASSGVQVGADVPVPPIGMTTLSATDNSSVLSPPYGETTFWYRVQALDSAGNASALSSGVGAHLKDVTPPAPPTGVTAVGFDDHIDLSWNANTEPDLDGYDIYRSLCHNGVCNPCDPNPEDADSRCTGAYALIGTVTANPGSTAEVTFDDNRIPSKSPLCYSYWIRAYDKAQNKSGGQANNPNVPGPQDQTVCQRLRDTTAPEAAVITGLSARDDSVRVDWVAPPVQDIAAYQIYRSETQDAGYLWVGGMTVGTPTSPPHPLSAPYTPPLVVDCNTIPLLLTSPMSIGSFVDRTLQGKKIYWYKVLGIDQNGNQASLANAAPLSTFTYSTDAPPAPTVTSISPTTNTPLGLSISWSPPFDSTVMQGFVVFRGDQANGLYHQIGNLLKGNQYLDTFVVKGQTSWYKILRIDLDGRVSPASAPVPGIL